MHEVLRNIIKNKDTNNDKNKIIGFSSISNEVQKIDQDQIVKEQEHTIDEDVFTSLSRNYN